MGDEFTHQILRMVVARICQPLGWHAMNSNAGDTLADVLKQYILTIARTTTAYSTHDNRTESNLVDLSRAFEDLGVSLPELAEFVDQVNSAPLDQRLPLYPITQNSTHVHQTDQSESIIHKKRPSSGSSRSCSTSEDSSDECVYIPPYLPPLPHVKDNEKDDDTESGIHPTGDQSDHEQMDTSKTPTPLTPHDPERGLPQSVRPRGFSSDFSEDGDAGGSRRSSVSDLHRERAFSRTPDFGPDGLKSVTNKPEGNLFDAAFRKELVKSNATEAESSKVTHTDNPSFNRDSTVAKKPKLPPLRLMNANIDSVFPTQQPPLSPLLRSPSNIRPIRQGLPILSPLKTPTASQRIVLAAGMVSPPMKDVQPPALKSSHDNVQSSANIGGHIPIKAQQTTPISAHQLTSTLESSPIENPSQTYHVPGSPRKLPLKEFDLSTLKLSVTRSKSTNLSPPPSASHDLGPRGKSPDIEGKSPSLSPDQSKSPLELEDTEKSPTPVVYFSEKEQISTKLDENDEESRLERGDNSLPVSPASSIGEDIDNNDGVVRLEEVLSRLSESESSEDEVDKNGKSKIDEMSPTQLKETDERTTTDSHVSSPVSSTHAHTRTPSPEIESTLKQEQQPSPQYDKSSPLQSENISEHVIPEQSDDNLSISAEGSDSDIDSPPPPVTSVPTFDYSSDIPSSPQDVETRVLSLAALSETSLYGENNQAKLFDKVDDLEMPAAFEEEVSAYSEMVHSPSRNDDSGEMIRTLSARGDDEYSEQANDYSEISKVLLQTLSSDDSDQDDESDVFVGEDDGGRKEEQEGSCVLLTSTEKVKGETKGRKRTVSKDDVLGIAKPKTKQTRKKGRAKARTTAVDTTPTFAEAPPPTTLVVSFKKSLLVQQKPLPLETISIQPPPIRMSEPLVISINRHLLRYTKFRLAPPTPEEKSRPFAEVLKIRLSKFGAQPTSTPSGNVKPPRMDVETTPTSVLAPPTRKRELEVTPPVVSFNKRPRMEPHETTPLSSSSSSSSSEDSASESPSPTSSPLHTTHIITPSHITLPRTPSSEDEDSSSSSSASSVSGVSSVGGGGLKLTISKSVLQQARGKLPAGGPPGWPSGKPETIRRPRKSQPTKFVSQATPTGKPRQKKGGKTVKKSAPGHRLFEPITLHTSHTLHPTPSLGSDTICPVCQLKDDGSPMIGCDGCDDWCHWRCVGVTFEPPADEKWYCPTCSRKEEAKKGKKKSRKRKR